MTLLRKDDMLATTDSTRIASGLQSRQFCPKRLPRGLSSPSASAFSGALRTRHKMTFLPVP